MATRDQTHERTSAIEDYAKAIYALERRGGEPVTTNALADQLEELIAAKLGDPTVDPHGDPIPTRELTIEEGTTDRLQALEPGAHGTFTRVSDSDPEMLRWLAERGIAPGDELEVIDKQPFDGPLFVRFGDDVHVLGGALAGAMRVEVHA